MELRRNRIDVSEEVGKNGKKTGKKIAQVFSVVFKIQNNYLLTMLLSKMRFQIGNCDETIAASL